MHLDTASHPTFVYLGANASRELERQVLTLCPVTVFVESAVYPERISAKEPHLTSKYISFDESLIYKSGRLGFPNIQDSYDLGIIDQVMDDKLIPLLWTRFSSRFRWRYLSEVKRHSINCSLTQAAILLLKTYTPKRVIFAYEPHMVPMYIFKKVCVAMGIETHTLVISPFSWRLFIDSTHHGQPTNRPLPTPLTSHAASPCVERFIAEKRSDYCIAKPFYEKRLRSQTQIGRLIHFCRANRWVPHRVIPGWRARRRYTQLISPRSSFLQTPFICVFLQFQPEQTTLPDGGLFANQLLAVQMLYAAASSLGLALVIREHPATFEYAFDAKWRPSDFYDAVASLGPNIHFDDLATEPYTLILHAKAVSAVTGTVLLEGLLQGRAAIAFGKHPLKGLRTPSFVDNLENELDLREKLRHAIAQPEDVIRREAEEYLQTIYQQSFGSSMYNGNANMTLDGLRVARDQALCQVIDLITKP